MTRLATSTALALCLGASPALADLTAQEVWDSLESALVGFGYTVTATEDPSSDGLDVREIRMVFALPDDIGEASATVPLIELTENGDGSVDMAFPQAMPITVLAEAPNGESQRTVMVYDNADLTVTVSGETDNLVYDFTATEVSLSITEMEVDGSSIMTDDARFRISTSDVAGNATTKTGAGQPTEITQTIQMGQLSYDIAMPDEDTGELAVITGALQSVTIDSTSTLPAGFNAGDVMMTGLKARADMTYASGASRFSIPDDLGVTTLTSQSASGAFNLAMADGSLTYDISGKDIAYVATTSDFPLPINLEASEMALRFTMPTEASESPEDVALALTLGGVTLSDQLWNIFDAGGVLPRDPATVVLDLSGQVTPKVSFSDPESIAAGQVPAELNALQLNQLQINIAGAELLGTGSFTFDNSDLETFGGMPKPTGSATFGLQGGNALIDKLIAMGLMTAEDAMGARMMMSMFAVPADGPDSLTSTIEVNDQGHVLANGMRIQ
ncbi:DUF2125 domain-containing protein [Marivita hallyeonensis]|uniref:DUF2125 domain-containing protein n=1 Tax=Marivita hallyeonensis TaxID=996342 RepID=A0A1M5M8R6_9RHOB|nr:DUF2125 domain-containing protein [Marivita hallyeonensis]SHG73203.1 hypothetical protein SAMN05443551_0417 [Marivita hallyeonensis]